MRERLRKIKKIRDTLLLLTDRIATMNGELNIVQKDLKYLLKMKKALEENINFLRKDKVIALVSGYKESTSQLIKVDKNLEYYGNIEAKVKKEVEINKDKFDELMAEYDVLVEQERNDNIILQFDPNIRKKRKK